MSGISDSLCAAADLGSIPVPIGTRIALAVNISESYDLAGKVAWFVIRNTVPQREIKFTAESGNGFVTITDQRVEISIPPDAVSDHDDETNLSDLVKSDQSAFAINFGDSVDGVVDYRLQGEINWRPEAGSLKK